VKRCCFAFWLVLVLAATGCGDDEPTGLEETNTAPVADAGSDQTVNVGAIVKLNGGDSSDEDAEDVVFYSWSLNAPDSSSTALSDTDVASPTFPADVTGAYVLTLTVTDGDAEDEDSVTITAERDQQEPPVIERRR
jgi:hypothetical protein